MFMALVPVIGATGAEPRFIEFDDTPAAAVEPVPANARAAFNAGTRRLREGKLREAETFFSDTLSKQDAETRPPALYNLGHVRFGQGTEELKKSPAARPASAGGRAAAQRANRAAGQADEALAGNDAHKLLAAYVRGRGARRDLKAATRAVQRALDLHGAALRKWQRALGDFNGAAELNPANTNAQHNAAIVEQAIARLVDEIRELQQAAAIMAAARQELGDKMEQLKGRIPDPLLPLDDGSDGDDGDEEGGPGGPTPELLSGHREGPGREGTEMSLSPDEASWLLDMFSRDGDRRLPMGQDESGQPKDRERRNW
jgi:tetratricopeptide (TPR) repeat protein